MARQNPTQEHRGEQTAVENRQRSLEKSDFVAVDELPVLKEDEGNPRKNKAKKYYEVACPFSNAGWR